MTRDEAKKLLPVIQAFSEGKNVQAKNQWKDWSDVPANGNPSFDPSLEWRIKKEPFECWVVSNKQGYAWTFDNKKEAESYAQYANGGPHTVRYMREVI